MTGASLPHLITDEQLSPALLLLGTKLYIYLNLDAIEKILTKAAFIYYTG